MVKIQMRRLQCTPYLANCEIIIITENEHQFTLTREWRPEVCTIIVLFYISCLFYDLVTY